MAEAERPITLRHTCPQCGDILAAGTEDEVVQCAVEHARRLHDLEVLSLVSEEELRATIRREYAEYWAHVEHLIAASSAATVLDAKLSDREREIVAFVVHGFSNREIARRLYISERTVTTHLANIYEKLEIHSRTALVALVRAADCAIRASLRSPRVANIGPFLGEDPPQNT